jgi:hypothetical protein
MIALQEVVKMETDLRTTFYGQLFVQQIGTEEAAPR